MIKSISVNKDKCIHCGMCIKDCIVKCLKFNSDSEKIPEYSENGDKMCVGCQHCMAVCPVGALSFGGRDPGKSEPIGYGSSDDLLRLIQSRRSIRFYKSQDIPQETLSKLADMLAFTPKGGNVNALYFSIVSTRDKMQAVSELTYKKLPEINSPMAKFFVEEHANGNDFVFRNAPAMIAVSVDRALAVAGCEDADPIIALSYLDLYAQSLGVGTLWSDATLTAMKDIPEALAMLGIPEGYSLNYVLLMGLPAVKYHRTTQPEPANVKII
ncbi:MAG: nitroreductase family protein [Synergistaceae bacterium]|nr:nitroreductase family protein [Synergistaceae bacterium]